MRFDKYQALGNDYLVLDPAGLPFAPTPDLVRTVCDRHFGVGSDGVLMGPLPCERARFGLRIFNPDGSEAEKSGNGLRIFARYLWDRGLVHDEPFTIKTRGGIVEASVLAEGSHVRVEMGRVSFWSDEIPVAGPRREVLQEEIAAGGRTWRFCGATMGNPHCVIPVPEAFPSLAREFGPALEVHPLFPNRTNVQFMQVLDRRAIRIEIWERGAGYTLASGSSSCAAAAAAKKLGLCDAGIEVRMAGGVLSVTVNDEQGVTMTGPVTKVMHGDLDREALEATRLIPSPLPS